MVISKKHLLYFSILVIIIYIISLIINADDVDLEEIEPFDKLAASKFPLQFRIVHFDLKAMVPSLKYLMNLAQEVKKQDVTGLMLEYGDLFPYTNKLANIKSLHSYSHSDLKEFLNETHKLQLQIIPLVDASKFVLGEKMNLAEINCTDATCSRKNGSIELLTIMLKEIINFHQESNPISYLHIGCGYEALVNYCNNCESAALTNLDQYIDNIATVYNITQTLKPGIKLLIWDDIFRNFTKEDVPKIDRIKENIQLVCRDFNPVVNIPAFILYKYMKVFGKVWAASAYSGVDDPKSVAPDLDSRYYNHFSWMSLISAYKDLFKFHGIILVGKSRYNDSYQPCDILPASYPSLILNLALINKFRTLNVPDHLMEIQPNGLYDNVMKTDFSTVLNCSIINSTDFGYQNIKECSFKEFPLLKHLLCLDFQGMEVLFNIINTKNEHNKKMLEKLFGKELMKTMHWCSNYYLEHNTTANLLKRFYDKPTLIYEYSDYRWNISRAKGRQWFEKVRNIKNTKS